MPTRATLRNTLMDALFRAIQADINQAHKETLCNSLFDRLYRPGAQERGLGWSHEQILASYPHLSEHDILACLQYAENWLHSERVYPVSSA